MKPDSFEVEHTSRSVLTLRFNVGPKWEQWFLLSADRHWDNPDSDQALQRKHLEIAKERNAWVMDFGDLFCAMQGKYDKRSNKSKVRKEHQSDQYLDALVETAGDWFAKDPMLLVCDGNHETAILKNHETHLTERLVERLRAAGNKNIHHGGFSGWVRFLFHRKGGQRRSLRLAYHHGYGGDAPVTKGVIQTNRMSVYLPDADFVVTGHTHNEWQFPIQRVRINEAGKITHDEQLHIKIPSYKDEYKEGECGWSIERGAPPKPIGAIWLRLYYEGGHECYKILSEVTRAK